MAHVLRGVKFKPDRVEILSENNISAHLTDIDVHLVNHALLDAEEKAEEIAKLPKPVKQDFHPTRMWR